MARFALPGLALLLVAGAAQAQVYKCVDAAGKVIYSQNPCPANTRPGSIGRRVDAPAYTPPPAAAAKDGATKEGASKGGASKDGASKASKSSGPKTAADQEQDFRKRQQDREKSDKDAEQKAAEVKRKEDNCRNARERLAQYEIGGRITRITPEGERYYLEDAQIEQQKAAARGEVGQYCN